jgi:hypothetical protein
MSDINTQIDDLIKSADAAGIALSAWAEPDFVWLSEITREASAAPGEGALWIKKLIALSHAHALPLQLCCTWWNDPLVAYYVKLGFTHIHTHGEEAFLECAPVLPT